MYKLKNYLKNHSIEELANYFKTHKIKPYAFNALVFFNNRDEAGYKEIKEELQYMCEIGQKIGYKEEMVSVELFRPEYYELEIEDAIKIAKEKTLAVVEKYFCEHTGPMSDVKIPDLVEEKPNKIGDFLYYKLQ